MTPDLEARIEDALAMIASSRKRLEQAESDIKELRVEVRIERSADRGRIVRLEIGAEDVDTRLDAIHEMTTAQARLVEETAQFANRVTAMLLWQGAILTDLAVERGISVPPKPSAPPPRRTDGR